MHLLRSERPGKDDIVVGRRSMGQDAEGEEKLMEEEMREERMFEKKVTARVFKGRIETANSLLNKDKAVEIFKEILDRAMGKKCRCLEINFTASVDEIPMFDYRLEEYVL